MNFDLFRYHLESSVAFLSHIFILAVLVWAYCRRPFAGFLLIALAIVLSTGQLIFHYLYWIGGRTLPLGIQRSLTGMYFAGLMLNAVGMLLLCRKVSS